MRSFQNILEYCSRLSKEVGIFAKDLSRPMGAVMLSMSQLRTSFFTSSIDSTTYIEMLTALRFSQRYLYPAMKSNILESASCEEAVLKSFDLPQMSAE